MLLQGFVDVEVWLRLGGHGIDGHVLLVLLGVAAAGILVGGVAAAGLVHVGATTARLRTLLALVAGVVLWAVAAGRRRRSDTPELAAAPASRPAGAQGPRAPGTVSRRPCRRTLLAG